MIATLLLTVGMRVHVLKEEVSTSSALRIPSGAVSVSAHGAARAEVVAAHHGYLRASRPRAHRQQRFHAVGRRVPETTLGSLTVMLVFALCGAAGWLASLVFTKFSMPEMWRIGVAQHQVSNGSSPATYGLAMIAAIKANVVVGTSLGAPWVAFFAVFVLPKFFSDKWGMNIFGRQGTRTVRGALLAVVCVVTGMIVGPALVGPSPSGTTFLVMYFLRIVLDEFLGALVFGRPFFGVGTDNASHLGGTLVAHSWFGFSLIQHLRPEAVRVRGTWGCACLFCSSLRACAMTGAGLPLFRLQSP